VVVVTTSGAELFRNGSAKLNSNASSSVSDTSDTPAAKRGRGRPRKTLGPQDEQVVKKVRKTKAPAPDTDTKYDHKIDTSGEYEFFGPIGVSILMVGFPLLMWYMWIGATFYNGKLPLPAEGESIQDFASHLVDLALTHAFPHAKAWAIYWTFFVVQGLFYLYLPGVYQDGKPLPHLGMKKLTYYCSGQYSFWVSNCILAALHVSSIFKLDTILDEFGPIMSVAIISGYLVSVVAYVSAHIRGATHRMTGNHIYDFFMGAELNPRLLGWLDFKMFFEVRIPWYILFYLSVAAATRQYERVGYVPPEVAFLVMAHFLYANACSKAEQLITSTWYVGSTQQASPLSFQILF
jgi:delta24(24(1))-sterol reductase